MNSKNRASKLPENSPLARRLEQVARSKDKRIEGAHAGIEGLSFPLSFPQRRHWFYYQWNPETPAFQRTAAFMLKGSIEIGILEECINQIIERHQPLRMLFFQQKDQVEQRIQPHVEIKIQRQDFTGFEKPEHEKLVQSAIESLQLEPFDLEKEPAIRVVLIKLGETQHALLFSNHPIVFDGWSERIFLNELQDLYSSKIKKSGEPIPELPIGYTDYVNFQYAELERTGYKDQLKYWQSEIKNNIPVIDFLPENVQAGLDDFQGSSKTIRIENDLLQDLTEFGDSQGVSLFMVLLAAFYVLLFRYTGMREIVIGSPIAGRSRPEYEKLIGAFTNLLPLKSEIDEKSTFNQLLSSIRKLSLNAFANQDIPIWMLLDELKVDRDFNRFSVFQVMFNFENIDLKSEATPPFTLDRIFLERRWCLPDLNIELFQDSDGITCEFGYRTTVFSDIRIERMMQHYINLLGNAVKSPESLISSLSYLTIEEIEQIFNIWSRTSVQHRKEIDLLSEIYKQSTGYPDKIALKYKNEQLTYTELNLLSDRIAYDLMTNDVGPEKIVGILMQPSLEMVVAVLSVLKSGGAYLALDPNQPVERNESILQEASPLVVITHPDLKNLLPEYPGIIFELDLTDRAELEKIPDTFLRNERYPDSLAYVIYTSGSTGRPNGVMIEDHSLNNYLAWFIKEFQFDSSDRFVQNAAFIFDASVRELLTPLVCGATLIIAPQESRFDPEAILNLIRTERITYFQGTPTLLRGFGNHFELISGTNLRYLASLGEELDSALAVELSGVDGFALHNLYGPTEATMNAAHYACESVNNTEKIPIGYPIDNVQVYILDQNLNLLPAGIPGEIHIGGEGVARGYINQPELTSRKFIQNPFGSDGSKLYRTGDLGRYLENGDIEFLGRCDHQVKLHGYKVELTEIELVLNSHNDVMNSAVVKNQDSTGEPFLEAYIVPYEGKNNGIQELSKLLSKKLPFYMMPSKFVFVDSIPLTASGKTDRNSLKSLKPVHTITAIENQRPGSSIEKILVKFLQEVLEIKNEISVRDNFFVLGGNSIQAMRIVVRIREVFEIDLSLRSIFLHPTIEELSEEISRIDPERMERSAAEYLEVMFG